MPQEAVVGHISRCQVCSSENLELVLAFGHQARVHGHLTKEMLHQPETKYPLNLYRCADCYLVQIDYAVDPKIVFSPEYPYHSGTTDMLVRNFRSLADEVVKKYGLTEKDLVVDIGSNDGTLLQGFKAKGVKVLGVEPTDNAKKANSEGIPTIQEFFTVKAAGDITTKHGRAKVVTAANVFAHINNLFEFLQGVQALLTDDGVFVSESQYLMDIIDKLEFDTIYDEHLRYYSLKPMQKLFSLVGFSLVDAERISAAGGSIRAYAMKGERPLSDRAKELIAAEEAAGIYKKETLKNFADRAIKAKHDLLKLLIDCKQKGARIASVGAPGRSNTLLGFTNIDQHLLDYLCERNTSPKIGLFSPGTHLPIVDEKKLMEEQPEYALVLSWHIGEELMRKIRQLGYKGKFIMPLPTPGIVENI